eukprot:813961-Amphidinium_carterae.1
MKRAARQSHELGFTSVGVPKLTSHAGVALLVRKPHRAVLLWKHDSGRLALFAMDAGLPIRGVMAGCALAVWMLGLLSLPLQIAVTSLGVAELRAFVVYSR